MYWDKPDQRVELLPESLQSSLIMTANLHTMKETMYVINYFCFSAEWKGENCFWTPLTCRLLRQVTDFIFYFYLSYKLTIIWNILSDFYIFLLNIALNVVVTHCVFDLLSLCGSASLLGKNGDGITSLFLCTCCSFSHLFGLSVVALHALACTHNLARV